MNVAAPGVGRARLLRALAYLAFASLVALPVASAQTSPRVVEFRFRPTGRAQLALWVEKDGQYLQTVRLTESVAYRGIGNRPGALQMNSGFRWPYGRREGTLCTWAHARASVPGAALFPRVIFQNRTSEGCASRTTSDASRDNYFCLSFKKDASKKEALDAVSCASTFNSDKGRYATTGDVSGGYSEPVDTTADTNPRFALDLYSLYPPRRDVARCTDSTCNDHEDVARFAGDARTVMPELDAITMATPKGDETTSVLFTVPDSWEDGAYDARLEINVEGDYNDQFGAAAYPTPVDSTPASGTCDVWDSWSIDFGYPYRGQPAIVYRASFELGKPGTYAAQSAEGYASLECRSGTAAPASCPLPEPGELQRDANLLATCITQDPQSAPGSGADRLRQLESGARLEVIIASGAECDGNQPPEAVTDLKVTEYSERSKSHMWAHLHFVAASDDKRIAHYDARVSVAPITDEASFLAGLPAKAATIDSEALVFPGDVPSGQTVDVDMGGLTPSTRYYVGVRPVDSCNSAGPIQTAEFTTPAIRFTTVDACFIATAAYGTPLAPEVDLLRAFRDRYLATHAAGRVFVRAYYALSPHVAELIAPRPWLRAAVRVMLTPLVHGARWLMS